MNFFMGGAFPGVPGTTGTPATTNNMTAAGLMPGASQQQSPQASMVSPFAAAAGVPGFSLNPTVAGVYNPYQAFNAASMMAAAAANPQSYAAYMATFQQQMNAAAVAGYKAPTAVITPHTQSSVGSRQTTASTTQSAGFNATGSSASNQSYTNYSEGSSSKSSTFNSNSGSIQKYNKPYTRDYQSGSRDNSRYSNKRSVTGSNSHPVSYNKTLTGGDSSSEYKNSSSSSSNRDNAGNNSGSFSTFGSPSKVGYVPSDKSGAYSSEVGGSSRITSGSSSSGSYQSQSSGGGGGSSSGSGYQRASSGAGDRSVGIQGSGGSSSSQYIPRGPLHYCDVCKISCAGPQTYKEHLEGQKHKKKEQQIRAGVVSESGLQSSSQQVQNVKPGQKTFYCELCDVTCTSADTYNAHARGAKHVKCVKLYQKMNKPIPPAKEMIVTAMGEEPTVVTHKLNQGRNNTGGARFGSSGGSGGFGGGSDFNQGGTGRNNAAGKSYGYGGSEKESTTASTTLKGLSSKISSPSAVPKHVETLTTTTYVEDGLLKDECDPEPIGGEYIDELRDPDTHKLIEFNCKLCDCKFNDPYAKDMHLKGRRHRIMYKRKVNPQLEVEIKPGFRNKKLMEDRERSRKQREMLHRRLAEEHNMRMQMRRLEQELYFRVPATSGPSLNNDSAAWESWDDRHMLSKHSSIYPSDEELEAVQLIVGRAEKVLKVVSDKLALEDMGDPEVKQRVEAAAASKQKKATNTTGSDVVVTSLTESSSSDSKAMEKNATANDECNAESDNTKAVEDASLRMKELEEKTKADNKTHEIDSAYRQVKGVMRIGALAKGLLLKGDKLVELAVLCQDRPTKALLARMFKCFSQQMGQITSDKYSYEVKVQDCAILMTSEQDSYKIQLKASLTSPAVELAAPVAQQQEQKTHSEGGCSSDNTTGDGKTSANSNLLNKTRCLALLAELRRAKWFQSRAAMVPSCVIVMRILKDLMRRNSNWGGHSLPLQWTMEVVVENTLGACSTPLSPGDAMRRVLESLAGGILCAHPIGVGVLDPCEPHEVVDLTEGLMLQSREDVTASAQQALRQIVFKQIHKLLGMEMIPAPTPAQIRKRRMDQMEMINKAREQNMNKQYSLQHQQQNETASVSAKREKRDDASLNEKVDKVLEKANNSTTDSNMETNDKVSPLNEEVKGNLELSQNNSDDKAVNSLPLDINSSLPAGAVDKKIDPMGNKHFDDAISRSELGKETSEGLTGNSEFDTPNDQYSYYESSEHPNESMDFHAAHHNDNWVDPGGEAAYEAMGYEDPYESYYGPLPQQRGMGFGYSNPRFFRPWRGGGMGRGGFNKYQW